MASGSSRPTSFSDRIKSRGSQASEPTQSVKIVDAENDFPLEKMDHLRVGSAHAVCEPSQDQEHINLMLRISTHTLSRYQPDLLPAQVLVDYRSPSFATASTQEQSTHTATTDMTRSALSHFEASFVDRQWLKGLYLCVLVKGQLSGGVRAYCFFGVFAHTLLDFIDRYQSEQSFNPNQLKAIVLARSTGEPSVEILEFMRMKFSFDNQQAVLEISRSE